MKENARITIIMEIFFLNNVKGKKERQKPQEKKRTLFPVEHKVKSLKTMK